MKQEILKIMEMNKSGTLTDEQAAELLAELNTKSGASESRDQAHRPHRSHGEKRGQKNHALAELGGLIGELVNTSLEGAMGEVREAIKDVKHSFHKEGTDQLSKVQPPQGEEFVFEGNAFQVSRIGEITLKASRMEDNNFQASKIQGFDFNESSLLDSEFQASSIDEMTCLKSDLGDLSFKGTKAKGLEFNESTLKDIHCDGSSLKTVKFQGSTWQDVEFKGASFVNMTFENDTLKDTFFMGASFKDSSWQNVLMKDCEFSDVKIVGCTFKNLDLKDEVIKKVRLNDQVIDGNDAFFKAIGLH